MAPPITVDTSTPTLRPPVISACSSATCSSASSPTTPHAPRGRALSVPAFDASCPRCIRARAFSAPPPPPRPRTTFSPALLPAVNRALARAALAHAAREPYGLGSPAYDREGCEVARFRHLTASVRLPLQHAAAVDPAASPSLSFTPGAFGSASPRPATASPAPLRTSSSFASSSSPAASLATAATPQLSADKNGNVRVDVEFRARYKLVQGPRPGTWRYAVTDDWSNAEASIRATPKLRRIVARAVVGLFSRRSSTASNATDDDILLPAAAAAANGPGAKRKGRGRDGRNALGIAGDDAGDVLKSSRTLPKPPTS